MQNGTSGFPRIHIYRHTFTNEKLPYEDLMIQEVLNVCHFYWQTRERSHSTSNAQVAIILGLQLRPFVVPLSLSWYEWLVSCSWISSSQLMEGIKDREAFKRFGFWTYEDSYSPILSRDDACKVDSTTNNVNRCLRFLHICLLPTVQGRELEPWLRWYTADSTCCAQNPDQDFFMLFLN